MRRSAKSSVLWNTQTLPACMCHPSVPQCSQILGEGEKLLTMSALPSAYYLWEEHLGCLPSHRPLHTQRAETRKVLTNPVSRGGGRNGRPWAPFSPGRHKHRAISAAVSWTGSPNSALGSCDSRAGKGPQAQQPRRPQEGALSPHSCSRHTLSPGRGQCLAWPARRRPLGRSQGHLQHLKEKDSELTFRNVPRDAPRNSLCRSRWGSCSSGREPDHPCRWLHLQLHEAQRETGVREATKALPFSVVNCLEERQPTAPQPGCWENIHDYSERQETDTS